ncbi:fibrobacter succinogenes major paralogous domain-containing protein [Fibrobacter sp. UWH1]|uniref:fibrobacter succinogenes major paralogous domain-containing protein n=1 Tax=Fibrobacter sp. UWH1 TaxID=1964354 RepID=UPI000B5275A6|nr:fibrobacter succinogenes major paralogous domain-containing protein [Fibrobacter sp. UWH1]OWV13842.1 hypothetical protein B7992_07725 [Fibrobacter sp. UWH1]
MNINFFEMVAVKAGFVAFALAMGLVACGDDGSTNGPSNGHNDLSASFVESEGDLPNCTESGDGSVSFVDGTKEGFVCKDRKWLHYDMLADIEENLPGCAGSREGLTAYLYEENRELKCVEGAWGAVGEEAGSSSSVFPSSSSSVIPGTAPESGSSVASSSSAKSSSSVASSSSAKSSSSVADKANCAYLNPNIDYGTMTDTRDGQVYKTVTIGTQTWMAENLNYDPGDVSSMGSYAWSGCYDNKSVNCTKYGRLYTWEVAMSDASCAYGNSCNPSGIVQGVCPSGWHLPSYDEWNTLFTYVGGTGIAGQKLKANTSLWTTYSGVTNDDSFGFAVLPAGYRGDNGYFYDEGYGARFWSSTEDDSDDASRWSFRYNYDGVNSYWSNKGSAFSVRCLRD